MKKTEKVFVSGNILKAYELNDLIAKLNELVGCVNDNDLETAKKTIDGLKKSISEMNGNAGTLGELTNVDATADSVPNGLYNFKKDGDVFALVKALVLGDKKGTAYDGASGKSLEDKMNAIIDGGSEGEVIVSVSLKELKEAIEILRSDVCEKLSVSLEDGFHFADATGYDIMNYTSEGFDAAKVSSHFIATLNAAGISGNITYEFKNNKEY